MKTLYTVNGQHMEPTTLAAMEKPARLESLENGRLVQHKGLVDADKWIEAKTNFLRDIYHFVSFRHGMFGDTIVFSAWRPAGYPRANCKERAITFFLKLVQQQ